MICLPVGFAAATPVANNPVPNAMISTDPSGHGLFDWFGNVVSLVNHRSAS
jgi:hypothetical protein